MALSSATIISAAMPTPPGRRMAAGSDRKSTRLNSSHSQISYAVFCLKNTADAAKIKLAKEPAIKPRAEWAILGKQSAGKLNNPVIVNGSATYGIDVRLPGMVYAAIRQ